MTGGQRTSIGYPIAQEGRSKISSMRLAPICAGILFFCSPAIAQKHPKNVPEPSQFEIGVFTFFDFGPPFDYYTIYIARPTQSGTEMSRYTLTPAADKCFAPAQIEHALATFDETVESVLGTTNPCAIPAKELARELKRCKKCMAFSGSKVTMQVNCGGENRLIRANILDRDMFDPGARTPENTSWTMGLLARLDKALGPGVMEKPAFPSGVADPANASMRSASSTELREIADGNFDALFPDGSLKFSDLYRQTEIPASATATVTLKDCQPQAPQVVALPAYPALAKAARIQGDVTVVIEVGSDGSPSTVNILYGSRSLSEATRQTVEHWKFPCQMIGQTVQATIEFDLRCPK